MPTEIYQEGLAGLRSTEIRETGRRSRQEGAGDITPAPSLQTFDAGKAGR